MIGRMRLLTRSLGVLCGLAFALRVSGAPDLTRERLVGVWHLSRIDYSGPHGETVDPFYQAGSVGMLIYTDSGWMSVQITAPHRRAFEVPADRLTSRTGDAALEVAAFRTYYAYAGTWSLDTASGVLTHHVVSSLLPAEVGMTYTQQVTLEGDRLIFTNRGKGTVRRKIWERGGPAS